MVYSNKAAVIVAGGFAHYPVVAAGAIHTGEAFAAFTLYTFAVGADAVHSFTTTGAPTYDATFGCHRARRFPYNPVVTAGAIHTGETVAAFTLYTFAVGADAVHSFTTTGAPTYDATFGCHRARRFTYK